MSGEGGMKFADLLSLAKNVPLGAFDWGTDAMMFLNRRLPDNQQVDLTDTGIDIYSKLISMNTAKMMVMLNMEVTINGNRLTIFDPHSDETQPHREIHVVSENTSQPTPTPQSQTDTIPVPMSECIVPEPSPKWPLIFGAILVAMLLVITVVTAKDTTTSGQTANREVAKSALDVIAEIIKVIGGSSEEPSPEQTYPVDDSLPLPPPDPPAEDVPAEQP
jgi:hypothetical protein